MSRLGTYDVVTMLLGAASYDAGMRRVMNRWVYNWAREGKITNYGDSKKAVWDSQEVLDQYARYVGTYDYNGEARPQTPPNCT